MTKAAQHRANQRECKYKTDVGKAGHGRRLPSAPLLRA
jgi:hypothetical protein